MTSINLGEKMELVDALLACNSFRDPEVRNTIIEFLPTELKDRIEADNSAKVYTTNIVNACLDYQYPNSIEDLLKVINAFEGNSVTWQNLEAVWSHISSHDKQTGVADTYSRVGEHICIDRRWECTTFDHMRSQDKTIPQNILAFQVPGAKGKSVLLRRFYYICQVDALEGKLILYAKVDFRDRTLTANSLVSEILESFMINLEKALQELLSSTKFSAEKVTQLRKSYEKIINQLNKLYEEVEYLTMEQYQSGMSQLQQLKLKRDFRAFCRSISDQWTIVLLLDTWEEAGAAGDWLLNFIPEIVELENVILVLAGREGLSSLESQYDEVIFRSTLEPMKYQDDCQRLAELKYGLKISDERAKLIINHYEGDLQQIDMVLKVMKDFPDLITPDPATA